jgi:hypothetical protein
MRNKNKLTVAEEFRLAAELFLPFAYWVYQGPDTATGARVG